MEYECRYEDERWISELKIVEADDGKYEVQVKGRGSLLNVVLGTCSYGNYLFIPQYECGCQLADFSDTYWNIERLSSYIGAIDATTVVMGIKELFV